MTVAGSSFRKAVAAARTRSRSSDAQVDRRGRRDRDHRGQDGRAQAHSNSSGSTFPLGPWTKWWNARALSGGLGVDEPRLGARGARLQHEAGRRVDDAGGPDGEEHEAALAGLLARTSMIRCRFIGSSTSPNQTTAGRSSAAWPRDRHSSHGGGSPRYSALVRERLALAAGAAGLEEAAVDLDQPDAAGAPVQPVHVLGHEEEAVAHLRLGGGEGVRGRGSGARRAPCASARSRSARPAAGPPGSPRASPPSRWGGSPRGRSRRGRSGRRSPRRRRRRSGRGVSCRRRS